MSFLEKVSNIGYVLISLMDLIFSTGYVINFKVIFLLAGSMKSLEILHEHFNLIALGDLLMKFY